MNCIREGSSSVEESDGWGSSGLYNISHNISHTERCEGRDCEGNDGGNYKVRKGMENIKKKGWY